MQSASNQRLFTHIRRAIWVYFFLLIFEGVFRKWLLPEYSDILLVIHDPVVLVIYLLAIKARVFPRNYWIISLASIAFLSSVAHLIAAYLK